MKRFLVFSIAITCMTFLKAQDLRIDKELKSLVDAVVTLRQTDSKESVRQSVTSLLSKDKSWTMMDELRDKNGGECLLTKKMKRFQLNPILTQVLEKRYGKNTSRGDFLNGEEANFNYSLIEKGIKAKGKVRYTFKGRAGKQYFVIVPCDASSAALKIRLLKGNNDLKPTCTKDKDGNYYLQINSNLKATEEITLEIENNSNMNAAIAILNHNTRK